MDDSGLLATPEPRRVTPDHIRAQEFPRVMRGYDTQAVELFRRTVAGEVTRLAEENQELAGEVARLAQYQQRAPAHADPGEQAARIIMEAQRQREAHLQQTRDYARQVGEDAERRHRDILADARAKAEKLAQSLLEDAHRQAADILAQAPMDAQRQLVTTQALAAVTQDTLRTFHASLAAALESLAGSLEHPAHAAADGARG